MNLLFVTQLVGQTRHFTSVLRRLGERGHRITILGASKRPDRRMQVPGFLSGIDGLTVQPLPLPASDPWSPYRGSIRYSANFFPYLHPKLSGGGPARRRALEWVDPNLREALDAGRGMRWSAARAFLNVAQKALPPDPQVVELVATGNFDAVIVTPLVFNQTIEQVDFVIAAHRLGVPVGFPVFSWDNLSTKGAIGVLPDEVYVWNQVQSEEASEVHGVPAERLRVLGAWRFDEFVGLRPSMSRDAFCRGFGLDPKRPMILYLGSSPFIAPDEGRFVAEWLDAIATSELAPLKNASVFLRAHPRSASEWGQLLGGASAHRVYLQDKGASKFDEAQLLFDALHHCSAAIGINTSAMLEAAALGVPVHAVRHPLAERAQRDIVHFDYLHKGGDGLIHLAGSMAEHLGLLNDSLAQGADHRDPRSMAFRTSFLDPIGPGQTPTERLVESIERLAMSEKISAPAGLARRVLRHLVLAGLRCGVPRLTQRWHPEGPA